MPITISIVPQRLSDGSQAYNVAIGGLTLLAVSEEAASELAQRIAAAINELTVEQARVFERLEVA